MYKFEGDSTMIRLAKAVDEDAKKLTEVQIRTFDDDSRRFLAR